MFTKGENRLVVRPFIIENTYTKAIKSEQNAYLLGSDCRLFPIVCGEHTPDVVERRSCAFGQIDDTGLSPIAITLVWPVLALEVRLEVVVRITDIGVAVRDQIDVHVLSKLVIGRRQLVNDEAPTVRTYGLVIHGNTICRLIAAKRGLNTWLKLSITLRELRRVWETVKNSKNAFEVLF